MDDHNTILKDAERENSSPTPTTTNEMQNSNAQDVHLDASASTNPTEGDLRHDATAPIEKMAVLQNELSSVSLLGNDTAETSPERKKFDVVPIDQKADHDTAIGHRLVRIASLASDLHEDWIDRTNEPLGEIGNGYVITPHLTSLYLTNNRLKVIQKLEPCVNLRDLVLRQNAITAIEGLDTLENLEELDLYINQIEKISSSTFEKNPKLKRLDLSFNQLRTLDEFPSSNLSSLEEMYLIGNKIRHITGMRDMPKLTMLELGDNRIRTIENLDNLTALQGLWLGRNKITQIQNLGALTQLKRLSIQSNRIETIGGLDHLVHLEELYLSHNGISSMHGIQNLTNLRVLDLSVNFIEHIEYVENLILLKEFWMNGNKLQSFDELFLLRNAVELETVYLEANPLASDPVYEQKALDILPKSLEQLDALMIDEVRHVIAEKERNSPRQEGPLPEDSQAKDASENR